MVLCDEVFHLSEEDESHQPLCGKNLCLFSMIICNIHHIQ